jgi:hypothetical protein
MFNVLSKIFGTGDVISKGMDLIDSMHTSDEEKIEANAKAKVDLMKAYAPFKVAQRYLAVMFSINFILAFWATVGLWYFDKDMKGFVDIMSEFNIGWIMLTIVGFYFGGGAIEGIKGKFNKKPK